jgi:hypothetical protein
MKKFLTLLLSCSLLFSMFGLTASAADSYWTLNDKFQTAKESGDQQGLLSAVDQILVMYPNYPSASDCHYIVWKLPAAAAICEQQGNFSKALTYYQKYLDGLRFLQKSGDDYTDSIKLVEKILEHLSVTPQVYVEASNPADAHYYGMKNEPKLGTYNGACNYPADGTLTNAYLLYAHFFTENFSDFDWLVKENLTAGNGYLEAAWNVPNETKEELDQINSGAYDSYIISNLQYLNSISGTYKVLLRFGAEINVWASLPQSAAATSEMAAFQQAFKDAFRRIASLVDTHAPNVAMVYSPNDISNWYTSPEDFYPGDEYVDWVGMSTYYDGTATAQNQYGSMDAYYSSGVYENHMMRISGIVESFGNRKPIMISECGFSYTDDASKAKASAAMKKFYAYVNMVYPQVKAVFHFNTDFGGKHYSIANDAAFHEAYKNAVAANGVMTSTLQGNPKGYTRFETLQEKTDTLKLYTYAYYPTKSPVTVSYQLDGTALSSAASAPYAVTIDRSRLTVGKHTLRVTVQCAATQKILNYTFYVGKSGMVSAGVSKMTDMPASHWAYNAVEYCLQEGILKGRSNTVFDPNTPVTRAELVTLLGELASINPADYGASGFQDVPATAEYAGYVAWAKENQIVAGVSATEFAPNANITREQFCTFVTRFCDQNEISLLSAADGSLFADDSTISGFAYESVYRCRNAKLVSGKGNNNFDPLANITRAELASLLRIFHQGYLAK